MPRELSMLEAQLTVEFPGVNILVSEAGDHAVVTAEIPGIDPKTLNIAVVNDSITLRCSRQSEELKEGGSYHRRDHWRERYRRQFTKTFKLLFPVETDRA